MNEEIRAAMRQTYREMGEAMLKDERRMASFLADILGNRYPGERLLLRQLVQTGLPRMIAEGGATAENLADKAAYVAETYLWREDATLAAARVWFETLKGVTLPPAQSRQLEPVKPQAELPPTYANSIGMEFVLIPAGTFLMGSPDDDQDAYDDEKPQHSVTISRPFYLGKYPVTQAQWQAVMGNNPRYFKGSNYPVETVSWYEVQEFIRKLNVREGHNRYRLPTEAEWEYACRAGSRGRYCFGDDLYSLWEYAWFDTWDDWAKTHPVGQKKPNAWGLYDMHGNVWEWCSDRDGEQCYQGDSVVDPQGPSAGECRVLRGGSWRDAADRCRSAYRHYREPDNCPDCGFRLALSPGHVSVAGRCDEAPPAPSRPPIPAPPETRKIPTHTNSIGMEFVEIPAGTFLMGSPDNDEDASPNEKPQHNVTISRPFYLGKYPVTQAQWEAVKGNNPICWNGSNRPVEQVRWHDVQDFIRRLNAPEGHSRYRRPTEAEWEYACRAGTTTRYSFGNDWGRLGDFAWFGDTNWSAETHPVGQKKPNAWGLYDMHGNVWEWCSDWYAAEYYRGGSVVDPQGPSAGESRVLRGGHCCINAGYCRSAYRLSSGPGNRFGGYGFRLALSKETTAKPAQAAQPKQPAQVKPPVALPPTYTNSIGMEFVLIPAGNFMMGAYLDADANDDEVPRHEVQISRPFYLGKYPVTQAQWLALIGTNPSRFKGPNRPVENVSWESAQNFIHKLNVKEGRNSYRLPTEAEWEYACKAGERGKPSADEAWYLDNSGKETHPVGQKKPNAWGLYDMHGNVKEWVQDLFDDYRAGFVKDPQGPSEGFQRVLRGGSFESEIIFCRATSRWYYPQFDIPDTYGLGSKQPNGFRIVLSIEK